MVLHTMAFGTGVDVHSIGAGDAENMIKEMVVASPKAILPHRRSIVHAYV